MTEKRFTVDKFIEEYPVAENDIECNSIELKDNGKRMTYKSCCDLLNEFDEKIKSQKRLIKAYEQYISDLKEDGVLDD